MFRAQKDLRIEVQRRAARRGSGKRTCRPQVEPLEDRITPAIRSWDGGGPTNLWTDHLNWQGDLAPTAGDDLVFGPGADATSLTNSNDFGAGAAFNSIKFTAAGYDLQGNTITLGAGGVTYDVPGAPGQNIIDLGLSLPGQRDFTVVQGGLRDALLVRGQVTGAGGIHKVGAGFLGVGRTAAPLNNFSGASTVDVGILTLHSGTALGSA